MTLLPKRNQPAAGLTRGRRSDKQEEPSVRARGHLALAFPAPDPETLTAAIDRFVAEVVPLV